MKRNANDAERESHAHKQPQTKFRKGKANIADSDVVFIADTVSCALDCQSGSSVRWYIDSGASEHMTNDESLFKSWKNLDKPISIGIAKHGVSIFATKIGMISGTTIVNGSQRNCRITDVLFVKNLKCNLFSVSRLEKTGFYIMFIHGKVGQSVRSKRRH